MIKRSDSFKVRTNRTISDKRERSVRLTMSTGHVKERTLLWFGLTREVRDTEDILLPLVNGLS